MEASTISALTIIKDLVAKRRGATRGQVTKAKAKGDGLDMNYHSGRLHEQNYLVNVITAQLKLYEAVDSETEGPPKVAPKIPPVRSQSPPGGKDD